MYCVSEIITYILIVTSYTFAQNVLYGEQYQCPQHWIKFQESCYRFIKSPIRDRQEAKKNCEAYQSDLTTINSLEEHGFILYHLLWQDPQHHKWYTGIKYQNGNWINEADNTQLLNMENAFLPEPVDNTLGGDYLVYSYHNNLQRWGLEKVNGRDRFLYICEAPISNLHNLVDDDRTYQYGIEIDNPREIPRGPYFIKQPTDKVFDLSKRKINNDVALSCLAGGYPAPTYEWFKEDYENDRLIATKIDPLNNNRYTISGGTLIIYEPDQTEDRGSYHCKATNKFGTIISESVELSFGYILEFNLKRSEERGEQNWGKVVYCDPPQHFPGVKYYWARDYFPNFVEEDKRVFVSHDGALYFSALEMIDRGNYSCNVQSVASDTGRNGPFFPLRVDSHSSFQQLKFSGNFPKAFPDAPIAGEEVRLECVAFGYPIPSYNWTRRGASLPRGSYTTSYNRVLIIPKVHVDDQGEYTCRVYNDRSAIENSVRLTIQAAPNFTIPLVDKHMDNRGELTWTCEAFGIPDVSYSWFRNGEMLNMETLPSQDRDRYSIQDNVLSIKYLDPERDQAMYQCRARNQLKTKYSSAQLRILSLKPSFKKRPMEPETYAAEKGNVTIFCNPEAAPRPKFVWKKDGNVIGSGGRRRILETGNLIISPVSRDDEGTYICTATNQYGSDDTRGRLIVLRGPQFIEKLPQHVTSAVMQNQTLRCMGEVVDEMLDVAYIWKHNGLRIRDEDLINNPRLHIDGEELNIINATFAEAGEYQCIIKSAVGEISSKTTVTIEGPPGPPGGVQVVNIVKTSTTLRWTDGAFNGKPITMYTVSARTNWNHTWSNIIENITAVEVDRYNGRKEAYLENVLNPYTTYEFCVSAFNELGYSLPSSPSPQYSTPPDKPTKVPSNIGGGGGKIGDLTITWDPLPSSEQNGPGIYYKVFWRQKYHETEFQSLSLKDYGNAGRSVVQIQQQYYYTEYEVKVQAANALGFGPISNAVTIFSAEDMPQVAPQQVVAHGYNSTSLKVSWLPIEQTRERIRGKLIGHRIKYWKESNKEEDAVYYLSRSARPWALVVGLQPDTYYYVKVMAYNSAGEGPESERYLERTFRKAPQKPPSSVNVYGVNPSTVRVVWRYVQPSLEEEPLIGYKIRVWELDQDMSTANDTIIPGGSKLEAYITNLSPGKAYHLRVLAFSNGGDGRMSSPTHTFQMGDAAAFRSSAGNKILDAALGADEYVIKAQVLAGGRGKGWFDNGFKGGVHLTKDHKAVIDVVRNMLGHRLITKQTSKDGVLVQKIMIAESVNIARETYICILMDRQHNGPVLIASPSGGMDIETVAEKNPELIKTVPLDIYYGIDDEIAKDVSIFLGFVDSEIQQKAIFELKNLWKLFVDIDALQVEINPLVETTDKQVIAVDAKIAFDDNAEFRQQDLFALEDSGTKDPREADASRFNLNYIGMDGNIGCLVNGAGLAMATMDIIKLNGGSPANFLDVGGSVKEDQVYQAFRILSEDPKVKAILVNVFGGIVNCATIAKGIIAASHNLKLKIPLVVRLEGTNVTEAKKLLAESKLSIVTANDLDEAAKKAVSSVKT
ncbi:contactin isoform X1 [Bombus vosnesenskii]|uniref:Succinate--CoA ligase [ADP-forming] subunit beta, mitochondrial n=1 Tax=Bombus vosnesenskii TaxID=207650 RepID=A0A6J3LLD0_9HYME|nr:contactin isoform X1 [Bombus vosnesenskii]XP_033366001.1 contactin isoform X1 [Bombus vosnesenskii]